MTENMNYLRFNPSTKSYTVSILMLERYLVQFGHKRLAPDDGKNREITIISLIVLVILMSKHPLDGLVNRKIVHLLTCIKLSICNFRYHWQR